ncbi:hypothetical protein [Proteus mirabilis]|uniref:hypothetical protein n=1 Tax=Proteus mirabilis TaxID=584 RepID=UPI0034D5E1BF
MLKKYSITETRWGSITPPSNIIRIKSKEKEIFEEKRSEIKKILDQILPFIKLKDCNLFLTCTYHPELAGKVRRLFHNNSAEGSVSINVLDNKPYDIFVNCFIDTSFDKMHLYATKYNRDRVLKQYLYNNEIFINFSKAESLFIQLQAYFIHFFALNILWAKYTRSIDKGDGGGLVTC